MNYVYSDDSVLDKALELINNGYSIEYTQQLLNLTEDDLDLIDFVIHEL